MHDGCNLREPGLNKGTLMLQSTANELDQILRDVASKLSAISESVSSSRPSSDKWSKKEILGHLIDSASNNHQRFVRAQLSPTVSQAGYEQERWVATQKYQDEPWLDLVALWKSYNRHLSHLISSVPSDKLNNTIRLGESSPMTLDFLMKDYLRHLKHHLAQILGN